MAHHGDIGVLLHRVWPAQADALTLIRREVRRWLRPIEVMPEVEADLVLAVNEAPSNIIAVAAHDPASAARVRLGRPGPSQ